MSAGDWKQLFYASQEGDLPKLKYYISEKVNPNYQHPEIRTTVLVEAIKNGYFEMVKYLLDNGADPSVESEIEGVNAYEASKKYHRPEVQTYLEQKYPYFKKKTLWEKISDIFVK